ncbi:hypothetical protein ACIQMR_35470 [Streptomyces sp. NPDC091376]|uniref:hypothetical protein n=1 Tax=Streptomyces sp. NPDC091376 TaxID=3365994 RepID=UPI003813C3A4
MSATKLTAGDRVKITDNPGRVLVGVTGILDEIDYEDVLQPYRILTEDGHIVWAAVVEPAPERAKRGVSCLRSALVTACAVAVSIFSLQSLESTETTNPPMAPAPWVVSRGPVEPYKPEPTVRPSTNTTRAGERKQLRPTARPTERVATPSKMPAKKHPIAKPPADVRISFYKNCTGFAQSCIDDGHLTMYAGNILAGHNYMGYQWLSRVPVGRTVRVISGPLAGTYKVYGHKRLNRQGGSIPDFGGAALVLQTCEGSGTGFSLLKRV